MYPTFLLDVLTPPFPTFLKFLHVDNMHVLHARRAFHFLQPLNSFWKASARHRPLNDLLTEPTHPSWSRCALGQRERKKFKD